MKLLSASAFLFLLVSMLSAQSPAPYPTDGSLELRLQPEDLIEGVPDAFTFTLVNASDHDIRLPEPAIECGNPVYGGTFNLNVDFKPLRGGEGFGGGCTNERTDSRPIMERVKTWKTLHPGESLSVKVSKQRLLYRNAAAGTYQFKAFYFPPVMSKGDRRLLLQSGIAFPQHGLSTNPIGFVKKP